MTRVRAPSLHQSESGLDESAYEVVGGPAHLSDDETDDGNTASLTSQSVDGRTPDDLSSIAGTEHSNDGQAEDDMFENVSRNEVNSESDFPSTMHDEYRDSDEDVDEEDDDAEQAFEDSSSHRHHIPRQAERHVDESELTARPVSPELDISMSPSLHRWHRQQMTDSEVFEQHDLPPPRALTWRDVKAAAVSWPSEFVEEMYEQACETLICARHFWKTIKLTYRANMADRDSMAFYLTVTAQLLFGLSLIGLVAWFSAHLTITFNRPATLSGPPDLSSIPSSCQPKGEHSFADSVHDLLVASPAVSAPKETITETGLGHPMQSIRVNESTEFVVHILGDNHFILTPPKSFLRHKKQPRLFVNVERNGETLSATVNTFDGVYAVEIDREQAWGLLDVSIYTKVKPKVSQQMHLNYGSPWLKMNIWQASAEKLWQPLRDEYIRGHYLLSEAMTQAQKELHQFRSWLDVDKTAANFARNQHEHAADLASRAAAMQQQIGNTVAAHGKALGAHLASMQDAMSKDIQDGASKLTKDVSKLYSTVRSVSPYHTLREMHNIHSRIVSRAQTNAANIVKKLRQKRDQRRSERRESKAAKKQAKNVKAADCGRKCQRKLQKLEKRAASSKDLGESNTGVLGFQSHKRAKSCAR